MSSPWPTAARRSPATPLSLSPHSDHHSPGLSHLAAVSAGGITSSSLPGCTHIPKHNRNHLWIPNAFKMSIFLKLALKFGYSLERRYPLSVPFPHPTPRLCTAGHLITWTLPLCARSSALSQAHLVLLMDPADPSPALVCIPHFIWEVPIVPLTTAAFLLCGPFQVSHLVLSLSVVYMAGSS